jgi:hypothetical protein
MESSPKLASACAYAGALLFAILIILFNTVPKMVFPIAMVAVLFHVVLFPVVAVLPSTNWAKAAGYGWLIVDIASNIMQLNGVDQQITSALRYGGHIPAIMWIIAASLRCNTSIMIIGILQALVMGSYSFVAPWVPMWYLYPAMVLLIIWLLLIGRFVSRSETFASSSLRPQ